MKRLLTLALLLAAAGCGDSQLASAALLAAPNALAAGGTDGNRLFVANAAEDAVQILDLSGGIDAADFVPSPSLFNPLRIPVGPNPTSMIASADGAWIAVLDPVGQALRLIDADALRVVRNGADEPYVFLFPGTDSLPVAMVRDPAPCLEAGCAGRFFVALAGTGKVVALRFLVDVAGAFIALERVYDVGGAPGALAVGAQDSLFALDAAAEQLVALDLSSGTTVRADLGARPGSLAISGDLVVVARPVFRDVVVFRATGGALEPLAMPAAFAPAPQCIAPCSEPDACAGAHPADQMLCSSNRDSLEFNAGAGTNEPTPPYGGVPLGVTPALMTSFSQAQGDPVLSISCVIAESEESKREIGEYIFVAAQQPLSTSSAHRWIEIDRSVEPPVAKVVDSGFCESAFFREGTAPDRPVFTEGDTTLGLDTWIDDCPEVPALERYTCVSAEQDSLTRGGEAAPEASGVVLDRGRLSRTTLFELDWEGPVNNRVNSTEGGGTVRADGSFKAEDFNITEQRLVVGDVLEILSTPRFRSESCAPLLGNPTTSPPRCELERRIVGFDNDAEALMLDRPLPRPCFPSDGTVSFRVRAGDSYVVRQAGVPFGIAKPGELFGAGGQAGLSSPILFRLRDIDSASGTTACERYDEGANAAPSFLRRDKPIEFEVHGNFSVQISGRNSFTNGVGDGPSTVNPALGELPTAMLQARFPVPGSSARTYVVIAFAGTDSLLILRPDAPLRAELGVESFRNDIRVVN